MFLKAIGRIVVNLLGVGGISYKQKKVLKVKYQDLCTDYEEVLKQIKFHTGIELENAIKSI